MIEKRLTAVPPVPFTVDLTVEGKITVANASLFKVKQHVILTNTSLPNHTFEVKRITDINTMMIGPVAANIGQYSDLSAYATGSSTIFANEQQRPKIPEQEVERATFEEEPVVARRVILVDRVGDKIGNDNPLPVAFDGTVNIGQVRITAEDNDPVAGDVHSSVRISDGVNDLDVNNDGSINVNVVSSPSSTPGLMVTHQEISAVVAGVETTMFTYAAPALGFKLYKVDVSGENIALFRVYVDTNVVSTKRTFFGNLNESFAYEPYTNGLELTSGQQLIVTVIHTRPFIANFEVTVMGLNL